MEPLYFFISFEPSHLFTRINAGVLLDFIYGKGEFPFSVALEDIHMNIEKRLTDDIGEAGGRLHTGRSRNDQCAVYLHMYFHPAIP